MWMVTGPGGRGMTCAPAIAADTLDGGGGALTVIGPFALAVLDMAGTTVRDDGAVDEAFTTALPRSASSWTAPGSPRPQTYVRDTMGQSKADVFAALLDPDEAARATDEFARAYERIVAEGRVAPMAGCHRRVRRAARPTACRSA